MQKWIIFLVIGIIICAGIFIVSNVNIETEYTPEIEIDEENLRKTMVSLYFLNNETKELEKETRLIDVKDLLKDPYKKMVELLIKGPENENLTGLIPEETEILDIQLNSDVLTISLTSDFLRAMEDDNYKNLIISSISNTLTEFKEINGINIIIEEKKAENIVNG